MIRLDKLYEPIQDKDLPRLRSLLQSLQGNILRGHGRDRSVHLFLHFKTGKAGEVKEKLRTFANRVTSAQKQLEEAEEYRRYKIPGSLFCNFFLAAAGYRYLGLDLTGYSKAFMEGMKGARKRLFDPPVETWETGYQQDIHAMVLLANNDKAFLLREARTLLNEIKEVADLCAVEHGKAMRNQHGHHIEHFGYVDGRSQPRFFQREVDKEKQEMDGTDRWDPSAGPTLVIVKEPTGHALDFGSYVVFRKLEQNVRGFKEREKQLASTLGLIGDDEERAGALVIGRFEDGTPVLLQPQGGMHTLPTKLLTCW